jgi:ribosomal protein S18 acetylase RimI-like enzyme
MMNRKLPREGSKKGGVRIRVYRKTDLKACRKLWKELTEKHREIYSDPTIGGDDPGMFFDDHLRRVGSKRIWIAEEGGEVVGLVGLVVEGEDAEIEPLVVAKSRRGRGIGGTLAKEAMTAAKEVEGVKFITVRPVARNKEAIEFFRKQGLVNVGRVEFFTDLAGKKWKKGLRIHGLDFNH